MVLFTQLPASFCNSLAWLLTSLPFPASLMDFLVISATYLNSKRSCSATTEAKHTDFGLVVSSAEPGVKENEMKSQVTSWHVLKMPGMLLDNVAKSSKTLEKSSTWITSRGFALREKPLIALVRFAH